MNSAMQIHAARTLAQYPDRQSARAAMSQLACAGFDIKRFWLVSSGLKLQERPAGYWSFIQRVALWCGIGALSGGAWGLVYGPLLLGPAASMADRISASFGFALEGGALLAGLTVLGAALYFACVPHVPTLRYVVAARADCYLLQCDRLESQGDGAWNVLHGKEAQHSPQRLATTAHPLQDG